ncbi:MAG: molybdopterin-dependent oxidoreductase [Desulfovibrio sp.]|jgi:anaerobic selenocysteine-containing dehydrogenase|nr:molybdopterin-dependent oxidoreductase [Desulfovibrio sp.]
MGLNRRTFIKFAAGAGAGVMITPIPWKLLDDAAIWTQNWPWIPALEDGENTYVPAFSKTDPSVVPIQVRKVNGRPVRVLPVPGHPLGGGVSALSAAEVQLLYSPARLKRPLLRGKDGKLQEISRPQATNVLLDEFRKAGANVAFITGDANGSAVEIISAFAAALGSRSVYPMPSDAQDASAAAALAGLDARIGYDLENSDHVLAVGADILESWGTVMRNRRIFRNARPHSFRKAGEEAEAGAASFFLVYAGPLQRNTAAVADLWLPVYPGTEGALALGIAHLLIAAGRTCRAVDFEEFKAFVAAFTPEKTAELTGVDAAKLQQEVEKLLAAQRPLVIVGSEFGSGAGAAPVLAGLAVNALLGNLNKPGGLSLLPKDAPLLDEAASRDEIFGNNLVRFLAAPEKPALLLIREANPAYALPDPAKVREAIRAVPFSVAFSSFMDETAALCNLIIPADMGLERMDDVETPYGSGSLSYCVSSPATKARAGVLNAAGVLLQTAQRLDKAFDIASYEDLLKTKAEIYGAKSFEELTAGAPVLCGEKVAAGAFSLGTEIQRQVHAVAPGGEGKLRLAPYVRMSLGTAVTGIPPYNNKTLRADELDGSLMSVTLNRVTAAKHKVRAGDKVALEAGGNTITAKVRIHEGVMNDTAAVCLGFGHSEFDEFSKNKGRNVMELLSALPEPGTGLDVWSRTGVDIKKA